jgi:hypothetical protein
MSYARIGLVASEASFEPDSASSSLPSAIDPWHQPDPAEPDPDFAPRLNARFHGHCGTCGGNEDIQVVIEPNGDPVWETCFGCGGTGLAKDEKLCCLCSGDGCEECGRTGLAVEVPYDEPDAYVWSDPWTWKGMWG